MSFKIVPAVINEKLNEGVIHSLSNYADCIKCISGNGEYKIGDIITKILIIKAKKLNLKKLNLTDDTYLHP